MQQLSEQLETSSQLALKTQQLLKKLLKHLEQGDDHASVLEIAEVRYCFGMLYLEYPEYESQIQQEERSSLITINSEVVKRLQQEAADLDAARLRGQLAIEALEIATRIRELSSAVPPWLDVLELTITRLGALHWRRLREQATDPGEGMAARAELQLLAGFAQRIDPVPAWVSDDLNKLLQLQWQQACEQKSASRREAVLQTCAEIAGKIKLDPELKASIATTPQQDSTAEAKGLTDAETSALENQLRDIVGDWMEQERLNSSVAELGLVYVPGARIAPHHRQQLELNLAAIQGADQQHQHVVACERMIEVFFEALKGCPESSQFRLREPVSSLFESLSHAWRTGEQVNLATLAVLSEAITSWNRCGGPGALGAQPQSARWPVAQLAEGMSIVVPTRLEIAALQCVLHHPVDAIEDTLAAIRRNHHNREWMTNEPQQGWWRTVNPDVQLRLLHTRAGFYASALAPMECVNQWSRGMFSALLNLQVVGVEIGAWFFAAAQKVFEETGRVMELHRWPEHQRIYNFLAGREVLVITPLAEQVESQHRSGKAFALFDDLSIQPYGLRSMQAPISIWPNRPHSGFSESLQQCLNQIDEIYQELPFSVLIASAGSYSLPICDAVQARYGVSCLRDDAVMHGYFGISSEHTANWRHERRKAENWIHCPELDRWIGRG